jgi:hypothetical protein
MSLKGLITGHNSLEGVTQCVCVCACARMF